MPLSICTPGEWDLVIAAKIAVLDNRFHHDPSKGKSELLRAYEWRCLQCQGIATYQPEEVERYLCPKRTA